MKSLLLWSTLFLVTASFAQQDALTTQFWNNYAHFNPATSGLLYDHHAAVDYRNQWDGVDGAPVSAFGNYGTTIAEHHGLGITYGFDRIGFTQTQDANLNYNYQFTLGPAEKERKLAIGLALGIRHFALKTEWIPPGPYNGESLPGNYSDLKLNVNAAVAYKDKGLFIGLSAIHLPGLLFSDGIVTYAVPIHYYAMSSYTFRLGASKNMELIPRILLRTDAVKFSAEFNLEAAWYIKQKQRLWLGAGYRYSDAVSAMLGIDLFKRYRIGYSYDITINKLSSISRGSHEIVLGYYLQNRAN